MRPPPAVPPALQALLRRQDGVVTPAQALGAGLSETQIRTFLGLGWTRPLRGVLAAPNPSDAFRTSLRAGLLVCPAAAICGVSAARLHGLGGLAQWTASEPPHLILPSGVTYDARAGLRLRSGLRPGEKTRLAGFPVSTLNRTLGDLAGQLSLDDLTCAVDSALAGGWVPIHSSRRGQRQLRSALAQADARSESTLETLMRLLMVRGGVPPEVLQYKVHDDAGRELARLDFAWPSIKLAVEADGRETHDKPQALYRDRTRANDVELEGWTILRFTWADLYRHREVVAKILRAINRLSVAKSAA